MDYLTALSAFFLEQFPQNTPLILTVHVFEKQIRVILQRSVLLIQEKLQKH